VEDAQTEGLAFTELEFMNKVYVNHGFGTD